MTEATDGETALVRLAANPVALVLLDLRMPGMDGFELARRLRALPGFSARLVANSASVLGFNRDDAIRAGADEFLPKPFKEEQLLDILQHQLRLKWRYAEDRPMPAVAPAASVGQAPLPAAELLAPLRAAANRGDIVTVRAELASLKQRCPEHAAVVAELEALRRRLAPEG